MNQIADFLSKLTQKRAVIRDLLCTIEPVMTAEDEISRSIRYLEELEDRQWMYFPKQITGTSCSYLPLNQPLYSFVLNVLTLTLACEQVYYRPPKKLWDLHSALYDCFAETIPSIQIRSMPRGKFLKNYTSKANVIVYTGRLENVLELKKFIRDDALLIYNGSALNPIIVTESADFNTCVSEIISARLYNTGQDCMAPAAIFVHEHVIDQFLSELFCRLSRLKRGQREWNSSVIGPMISESCYLENMQYLLKYKEFIVFGGECRKDLFISPTVFLFERYCYEEQPILYAPFFLVYKYRSPYEIHTYLTTKIAKCYKGYLSIYGKKLDIQTLNVEHLNMVVLDNTTLLNYENGNMEFGGYGMGCSFVIAHGNICVHPILLLREMAEWRQEL